MRGREEERKQFFFEKKTKKLLSVARGFRFGKETRVPLNRIRVFWFFFSKRTASLLYKGTVCARGKLNRRCAPSKNTLPPRGKWAAIAAARTSRPPV